MRETWNLNASEMTEPELVSELRRVRAREGKGSEEMGGWRRQFSQRETAVTKELLSRQRKSEVAR